MHISRMKQKPIKSRVAISATILILWIGMARTALAGTAFISNRIAALYEKQRLRFPFRPRSNSEGDSANADDIPLTKDSIDFSTFNPFAPNGSSSRLVNAGNTRDEPPREPYQQSLRDLQMRHVTSELYQAVQEFSLAHRTLAGVKTPEQRVLAARHDPAISAILQHHANLLLEPVQNGRSDYLATLSSRIQQARDGNVKLTLQIMYEFIASSALEE
jgi:hypothetical protein